MYLPLDANPASLLALILQLDILGVEVGQLQWGNGFIEPPDFVIYPWVLTSQTFIAMEGAC